MSVLQRIGRWLGWATLIAIALTTTGGFVVAAILIQQGWCAAVFEDMSMVALSLVYLAGCLVALSPWWAMWFVMGQHFAARNASHAK